MATTEKTEMKPNKGVQGTLHKVSGPLTPDVHMAEGKSMGQRGPVFHIQSFFGSEI